MRDFLLEEAYVHRQQDEPAIIDWCVREDAQALLCHLVAEWQPKDLCLQGCVGPGLLEAVIPKAVRAGVTHLSLSDCVHGKYDDSDDECDRLVQVLAQAACNCDALSLENVSLLSSGDLQSFLEFAGDRGGLTRLSLCRVSGMDDPALNQLAFLLTKSRKLEQLSLGELAPCTERTCSALAKAIADGTVKILNLQGCDPRFLIGFLTALNALPDGVFVPLTELNVSYVIPGDAAGKATADGQQQSDDIDWQIALLLSRHGGLRCDPTVQIVCVDKRGAAGEKDHEQRSGARTTFEVEAAGSATLGDPDAAPPGLVGTLECFHADEPAPQPPRERVEWNPRVIGHPRFVRALWKRLRWGLANPIEGAPNRWIPVPDAVSLRIVFHLAAGDPLRLMRLLKALNWHHHKLWDEVYQQQLEARVRQDMRIEDKIEDLLVQGKTTELIRYAARLRKRGQVPSFRKQAEILARASTDVARREGFLWAFNPAMAIEVLLATGGRMNELFEWAQTLKEHQALPAPETLESLIEAYIDQPDVLPALYNFL